MGLFGNHTRVGASAAGDYEIERSLRFNPDDNNYLSRTSSAASNTYTLSMWVKRCSCDKNDNKFLYLFGADTPSVTHSGLYFWRYGSGLTLDGDNSGSYVSQESAAKYRDPAAWLHVVYANNSGTANCWVNNIQTHTNVYGFALNTGTDKTTIGRKPSGSYPFNGYIAEVHLVDGQNLTPSSFAETNADTGQWVPKKYVGSHGTDGFYLKFTDNSAATASTLGKDYSGNGNNLTPHNFGVSAGPNNDSLTDTPSNNYATFNPITTANPCTFKQGNMTTVCVNRSTSATTFGAKSGKWYAEITCTAKTASNALVGIATCDFFSGYLELNASNLGGTGYGYKGNGDKITPGPATGAYGASYAVDDVIGIALDLDSAQNTVTFYKNGASQGSIDINNDFYYICGSNLEAASTCEYDIVTGQRPFAHTVPTGFKTLCSKDLPEPTIKLPTEHFDSVLYTGTGASHTITGLNFQPSFAWFKSRSQAFHHTLIDAVRGTNKQVWSNRNEAEQTDTSFLTSFNSNGFTLGDNSSGTGATNTNTHTYVAWNWKGGGTGSSNGDGDITATVSANASAGFSIVKYTGNGSTDQYVGHGLGVTPELLFHKNLSATANWLVRTTVIDGSIDWAYLNNGNGFSNASAPYTNAWSSTKFSIGTDAATNTNAENYITYCFTSVEGYSRVGVYEGTNNSVTGPMIYCGFKPALLLIKNIDADARHWVMKTGKIHEYNTGGGSSPYIRADDSTAETTGDYTDVDLLSNGFKCRQNGSYINSAATFIYLAFAESPFKYANAR